MSMKNLRELYSEHQGKVSDKWDVYLNEYDRVLEPYRNEQLNLLEIGVQNGGSLDIWNKYFPYANAFIGCDINTDCSSLEYDAEKISIVVGDANSDETETQIRSICRQFDIIIDDGSHTSADIVRSFARYFPYLQYGGVFIVEDLHCSYWKSYGGGLYDLTSSISFFKSLVDVVNYEHWGLNKSPAEVVASFNAKYGISLSLELLSEIHSVEFINSLCVIRKQSTGYNRLGRRNIVGQAALVVPGLEQLGCYSEPLAQDENDENSIHPSVRISRRDEAIAVLQCRASDYEERVEQLQSKLTSVEQDVNQYAYQVNQLEGSVLGLQSELEQSRLHASSLEHDLASLYASTSWNVSKPVRAIKRGYMKVGRIARLMIMAPRAAGGVRPLIRKALNLYRAHGIRGVLLGYHYLATRSENPESLQITDYTNWVQKYDTISTEEQDKIRRDLAELPHQPLISIIMPIYNPGLDWLADAIESVKAQLYENWELCLADDKSTKEGVTSFLERMQDSDSRIKVVFREENGHISAASNSAIEIASGQWYALMDQDDLLTPDALSCVVKAINHHPELKLIYSDEDKVNEEGKRFSPYFKSDFNRHLFYSHNMISHFGVYEADLVNGVGGFRKGYEGSQDYDLALRCIEHLQESQIFHIPKVLYNWRVHAESTAGGADAKPYAMIAGERALNSHFTRIGVNAVSEFETFGYRTRYALPDPEPSVSIIVCTRNQKNLLKTCIDSVLKITSYSNYEILIVDNGSDDPECLRYLKGLTESYPQIHVFRYDAPFNFSELNNYAVDQSDSDYVVLLNNDIEVLDGDWLRELISLASQEFVGAVGAKLLYPNGTVQHAGVVLGIAGAAGHAHKHFHKDDPGYFGRARLLNEFSAVTGACLAVAKSKYLEVGGLDPDLFAVAYNDVDFCLKLRDKGYRNVLTPYCCLIHHESVSRGSDNVPGRIDRLNKERASLLEKWGDLVNNDPCYSPNLTLDREDFSLAWPPRRTI